MRPRRMNNLLAAEMFREIALLAQRSNNVGVRQQLMTLDRYAFPFIKRRTIPTEKAEDIIAESCKLTFSFGPSDGD